MTSTAKPVKGCGASTYKVKFQISVDDYSYFMICGVGHAVHQGHPMLECNEMPLLWKLESPNIIAMMKKMANHNAHVGLIT